MITTSGSAMGDHPRRRRVARVVLFALVSSVVALALAQAPVTKDAAPPTEKSGIEVLKGAWVRPDGGYTIVIKGAGPTGQLDAMYFNPSPLPFAKAQAIQQGGALRVFLELRAGGYNGSTYELTYDRAADQLKGIYYQAVAQQKYNIYFVRK